MHSAIPTFRPALGCTLMNAEAGRSGTVALNLSSVHADRLAGKGLDQKVVQLYDAIRPSLYRYLISSGLVPQDVEDVVQEAFLRLFRHLRTGGSEENIRGWIFQVAHNLSVNLHKGRRRTVETTPDMLEHFSHSIVDQAAGPEEQVLRQERLTRIHQGFKRLTEQQRNCLLLRIEGFRYKEIGEMLNIGTSTVSGSLRNAIHSLAKGAS
jgi:RNA polymerase sigma-70 factor, ECF subfamily